MSKISISNAIRMVGISRSHFYKNYINKGLISIIIENNKKLIDISELIRVFGNIQLENNNSIQQNTTKDTVNTDQNNNIIEILQNQLNEAITREKEAKEREIWLRLQIDELRHQQSNLLQKKTQKKKKFFWIF
ncbi:hypothetical protein KA001_02655 [Patescibacteria group bacterium]|nr:hypothetical protein [Patescibacteria group bacterium]